MLVPLALFGAGALPVSAYLAGHPFRIRYEIPLVVACAVAIGLASGCSAASLPSWPSPFSVVVVMEAPPFDPARRWSPRRSSIATCTAASR